MSNETLQNNLYWQLLRVAINAKHGLMNIAEKHKISVMQLYTLCLLENGTSIPMNTLSCMLNCDASNVTGIVDRLFQQKYIKREENPQDRRAKLIALTPKGTKLCEKLAQEITLYQPDSLKLLSEKQKNQLLTLLTKVSSPLEQ
ncbi:MAG TPA: MarR family transcriptional regulator [Candidatus Sulfotelmatobacter sp.]|jgi:DNA-binding MarR family transcriptional regulator|nr:MarR family transcriptional regulator [Candidatus Sulfotelmatobacter sp.]